jgi:hypothetical protein
VLLVLVVTVGLQLQLCRQQSVLLSLAKLVCSLKVLGLASNCVPVLAPKTIIPLLGFAHLPKHQKLTMATIKPVQVALKPFNEPKVESTTTGLNLVLRRS